MFHNEVRFVIPLPFGLSSGSKTHVNLEEDGVCPISPFKEIGKDPSVILQGKCRIPDIDRLPFGDHFHVWGEERVGTRISCDQIIIMMIMLYAQQRSSGYAPGIKDVQQGEC
jgi:hypothetical protein